MLWGGEDYAKQSQSGRLTGTFTAAALNKAKPRGVLSFEF